MNISIVLIIKDDPLAIECALLSINSIRYPKSNFEVIVVDDGSSIPFVDEFEGNVFYELHIHYLDRVEGISCRSRARNFGASKAKYDYLLFVDGDSFFLPNTLERYRNYFSINTKRAVVLGTRHSIERNNLLNVKKQLEKEGGADKYLDQVHNLNDDERIILLNLLGTDFWELKGRWAMFWSCNFLIKRTVFEEIGKFDEAFVDWGFEDVELGYRLYHADYEFDLINNPMIHLANIKNITLEKYGGWINNLGLFYKKHDDVKILQQMSFDRMVFASAGAPEDSLTPDESLDCYRFFEKKIRYFESLDASKNKL